MLGQMGRKDFGLGGERVGVQMFAQAGMIVQSGRTRREISALLRNIASRPFTPRTMRIILLLLLAVVRAHSVESVAANPFEPKAVAPAAVVKLAEAYMKSASKPAATPADAKRDFERTFLIGFTQPNVSIGNPNEAETHGLEAGHAYRREHPDKLKEILEGYGYVATEADGFWKAGFEVSDFKPKKNPKETWWITVIGEEGAAKAGAERVHVESNIDGQQVHVIGFLSPEGHYGHFGVGQRELFATSITAAKAR
jgi:hypothetical protein